MHKTITYETVTTIPPLIHQHYNAALLSVPVPKFRDDSDVLLRMIKSMEKLEYKLRNLPKKKGKYLNKKYEILELYERIKIKEKERETEKRHKTQGFGYFVSVRGKMGYAVYDRLRWR